MVGRFNLSDGAVMTANLKNNPDSHYALNAWGGWCRGRDVAEIESKGYGGCIEGRLCGSGSRISDGELEDRADNQFHAYKMLAIHALIDALEPRDRYLLVCRYKEREKDDEGYYKPYNHRYAAGLFRRSMGAMVNGMGYDGLLRIAQNRFNEIYQTTV